MFGRRGTRQTSGARGKSPFAASFGRSRSRGTQGRAQPSQRLSRLSQRSQGRAGARTVSQPAPSQRLRRLVQRSRGQAGRRRPQPRSPFGRAFGRTRRTVK